MNDRQIIEVAREKLRKIVDTSELDGGVVLLSQEGTYHNETHGGRVFSVYDHDYFSPLGDALIDLYLHLGGKLSSGKQESNDGSQQNQGEDRKENKGAGTP